VKLAIAVLVVVAAPAAADPYRLRADALASTPTPSGLVALQADGEVAERVRAEALLWFGDDGADALVAVVEARRGPVLGRFGRMIASLGALRPVHVDGVAARVRLPRGLVAEAFGGVPVVPAMGMQAWDWVVGARGSRLVGAGSSVGVAWIERREQGRLAAREVGVDGGAALGRRSDLGATATIDLIHGGLAEARAIATTQRGAWRGEAYAGTRSPGLLIPATSLFSVIGDVASRRGGVGLRWRVAPRLDVRATLGGRAVGTHLAEELMVRAELRLDDRGAGTVGVELRREGAAEGGWTGARATARVPVARAWTASVELELAIPDDPAPRTGRAWPWALAALAWRRGSWEAAGAIEASASPEDRARVDVLARLGRRWELR